MAEAAVEHAEESLRIVKNRYRRGLATGRQICFATKPRWWKRGDRRLRARYDQRIAAVMVELAAGTLTGDSDVLR